MRLKLYLREATIRVKSREDFERHLKDASEDKDVSINRYGPGDKKYLLTKTVKKKLSSASPTDRLVMLKKYTSDKEIKSKDIEEIILHYGNLDVVWKIK